MDERRAAEERAAEVADLGSVPLDGPDGVVWALGAGHDLNANLVRLAAGGTVGDHRNDEVDVLVVVLAGGGAAVVDGEVIELVADRVVAVPQGARRGFRAGAAGLLYLTVHRQRGPLQITPR
jgi:quercetin dioxygenase-like cupin family protein